MIKEIVGVRVKVKVTLKKPGILLVINYTFKIEINDIDNVFKKIHNKIC